jgi:hypothetical protein
MEIFLTRQGCGVHHAVSVRLGQLEVRDGVREPLRLLLAISMPQDGSMMPISLVPLKGVVRALGAGDL